MVTFQHVIFAHQQRKDKSYPVKIRVTYKRKSKYLATNIIAQPSDLTRNLEIKNRTLLSIVHSKIVELEDAIGKATYSQLLGWDVDDVIAFLKRTLTPPEAFRLDFVAFGREKIKDKKESTARGYNSAINALCRFYGSESVDISLITTKTLREFENHLASEKTQIPGAKTQRERGDRSVSSYMAALRHIYNLAREEYNNPDTGDIRIPNNPFEYYKVPSQKKARHRDIDKDTIQMMINSRPSLSGTQRFAVDAFLISFCLFGMNATDMFDVKPPKKGVVAYERNKTGVEVRVKVEPCVRKLINEHSDVFGERMFNFYRIYKNSDYMTTAINKGLKAWADDNKVERFTMYSARHSFATICGSKKCNVDKHTINDCLAHVDKDMKVTDIYIHKDWNKMWDANKKLLALFDWSPLKLK